MHGQSRMTTDLRIPKNAGTGHVRCLHRVHQARSGVTYTQMYQETAIQARDGRPSTPSRRNMLVLVWEVLTVCVTAVELPILLAFFLTGRSLR